jgi:glycosyltransferase involved in cell wall biosynthesis
VSAAAGAGARVLMLQTQAEAAGAQEVARLLMQGLRARGYQVHQTFFYRRTASYDAMADITFCECRRPGNPIALARLLWSLRARVRQTRPDVVLTFQHYGNLIGAFVAKTSSAAPVIATQTTSAATLPAWLRRLDRWAGESGLFDRIIVNSEDTRRDYTDWPDRYRARMTMIEHGFADKTLAISKAEARARLGVMTGGPVLPGDAIVIGGVGRLHAIKNFAALVRMLPAEPGWRVAIAGQGPERANLIELAAGLGVGDRLHLAGELSPVDVGLFLACLDVFVFPTRAESFGLAVAEAAQAGVPVVSSDLPVLREVLASEGEPCALFADASDPSALLAATRRMLGDPALAATLSSRGRRLSARYSVESMVEGYEREIVEALRAKTAT